MQPAPPDVSPLLDRPLSAEMGKAVIEHLAQRCALPSSGVLAGQSVTSALLKLYGFGGHTGPINDVDVFFHIGTDGAQRELDQAYWDRLAGGKLTEELDFDNHIHRSPYFGGVLKERGIRSVGRSGLLNVIEMDAQIDPLKLVSEFDLNLVSVGVDLATAKMVWTPEFEQFMRDGALKVTNRRAQRTFSRVLKKKREMPWIGVDLPAVALDLLKTQILSVAADSKVVDAKADALLDREDPSRAFPRYADLQRDQHLELPFPSSLQNASFMLRGWSGAADHPLHLPTANELLQLRGACEADDLATVKALAAARVPLDFPLNSWKEGALHVSAFHGAAHVFEWTLDALRLPVDHPDTQQAAWKAARQGHISILEILRARGFNLNHVYEHYELGLLGIAGQQGNVDTVKWLIDHGVSINSKTKSGHNLLTVALGSERSTPVIEHLLDRAIARGTWPKWNSAIVNAAVKTRHAGALVALHVRGAEMPPLSELLYRFDSWNREPIMPLARRLQQEGADPRAFNERGNAVVHELVGPSMPAEVIDWVTDFNQVNEHGYTALMGAAMLGNLEVARTLLERGASAAQLSSMGSAMEIAVAKGQWKICILLRSFGVEPDPGALACARHVDRERAKAGQVDGPRPYEHLIALPVSHAMAALGDSQRLVDRLECGADPNERDSRGCSIVATANEFGQEETAAVARSKQAQLEAQRALRDLVFSP